MKDFNSKRFVIMFLSIGIISILALAGIVIYVDPLFHYHKPIKRLNYVINNERYQNDGILRHFEYDAIITGTSMTENFKASEVDKLFGVNSIKVPFSGGTYREMNDNLKTAFRTGHKVKVIIRALDENVHLMQDSMALRKDLGQYPTYLYNDNYFDDLKYILNKSNIKTSIINIIKTYRNGNNGGITNFDEYANWNRHYKFGSKPVLGKRIKFNKPENTNKLSTEDKNIIKENVEKNVTALIEENPDTKFYYFFPPYSLAWWGGINERGDLEKVIDAEEYAITLMLHYKNLELYSWHLNHEIVNDLNNYKDDIHYGEWINSKMLEWMIKGEGRLTRDNYQQYLKELREYYRNVDYNILFKQ